MRNSCLIVLLFVNGFCNAQRIDSLNTAKDCLYITVEEREMIYEINRLRSNPRSYLQYIEPMLAESKQYMKKNGKGPKNYSLTYTHSTLKGKGQQRIDTTWHYVYEEEVKALNSLVNDLQKLKRLSVLQADSGIYQAAKKHQADQDAHDWKLLHTGSDSSNP